MRMKEDAEAVRAAHRRQRRCSQDEHSKVHWRRTSREIDEDVPVPVCVVADWKLVWEVPHGHVRSLAEDEARVLVVLEAVTQPLLK